MTNFLNDVDNREANEKKYDFVIVNHTLTSGAYGGDMLASVSKLTLSANRDFAIGAWYDKNFGAKLNNVNVVLVDYFDNSKVIDFVIQLNKKKPLDSTNWMK